MSGVNLSIIIPFVCLGRKFACFIRLVGQIRIQFVHLEGNSLVFFVSFGKLEFSLFTSLGSSLVYSPRWANYNSVCIPRWAILMEQQRAVRLKKEYRLLRVSSCVEQGRFQTELRIAGNSNNLRGGSRILHE